MKRLHQEIAQALLARVSQAFLAVSPKPSDPKPSNPETLNPESR